MDRRLQLHDILIGILGSKYAYFNPDQNIKLVYPCIIYKLSGDKPVYANNKIYKNSGKYSITYIGRSDDMTIPNALEALDYCAFERKDVIDNLYHFYFTIYY